MGLAVHLFKIIKYVQILILGICFGIPLNIVILIGSMCWSLLNEYKMDNGERPEFDNRAEATQTRHWNHLRLLPDKEEVK